MRYGTPVYDLSFFMYMSMNENVRKTLWNKLLEYYHENVVNCLADILKCERDDEILNQYRYYITHPDIDRNIYLYKITKLNISCCRFFI